MCFNTFMRIELPSTQPTQCSEDCKEDYVMVSDINLKLVYSRGPLGFCLAAPQKQARTFVTGTFSITLRPSPLQELSEDKSRSCIVHGGVCIPLPR